jgi:thiol-disulfide isomerase/thioredoxin
MNMRPAFLLLVAALVLSPLAFADEDDGSDYTAVGEKIPEIDFTTVDGARFSNDTMKGHVVVFNFFATWCGPCRNELPHVEADVWNKFKDRDDFMLAVVGREHTAEEMNAFRRDTGYTFPLAADPARETYSQFAEKWIPRNYVIGRDGTILFQSRGYDAAEFAEMIAVIEQALDEKPKTAARELGEREARAADGSGSKPVSVTVSGETRIRVQHRDN